MARLVKKTPRGNLRLRHPSAQMTNAKDVTGINGCVPEWAATLVIAATVRIAVAVDPFVVTGEGEKLHDSVAGSPVHPRETA